jgi:hypothetical protein
VYRISDLGIVLATQLYDHRNDTGSGLDADVFGAFENKNLAQDLHFAPVVAQLRVLLQRKFGMEFGAWSEHGP